MTDTLKQTQSPPESTKKLRDFYKVLLVSQSGKGKTYSFRNVDPNIFGLVNIECKPLPFKNSFKYHCQPTTCKEAIDAIIEYAKNPEIRAIGIDSFSAFAELLIAEARAGYEGWDVWTFYNKQLAFFFTMIKKIKKEVFLTAHYEILGLEGIPEKRVKVQGKAWEGTVEKEFTVVLYGDSKTVGDKLEYNYHLTKEGTPAKCPPDIFGPDIHKIPNDVNLILEKIVAFAS